ncbi:hypothetical protein [Microcella frigidaquae]|uniref:Uncharacterized protein n=1 Tax=Microcella frigidaquae TaxID=424758 RepID=A0A840X4B7_9MICO|nr:hypothetical protein [Microcella frigidaquae]MBB5617230.1 hypothetical protein [Microcella frigidaquae]NHN45070.1 hypothetical protein [Microcella frigidaquae]
MTPVERLRAAIEKLESMRAACTPGDWDFESMPETGESRIYSEADGFAFMSATTVTFFPVPGGMKPNDAELIVTLHRTIDAQISILRAALARAEAKIAGGGVERAVWSNARDALALADAILGSDR